MRRIDYWLGSNLSKRYWLFGSTIYLNIVKLFLLHGGFKLLTSVFFVFKEKTQQQQLSPSEQPPSNRKLMCRGQWEKEIFGKEPNYPLKLKCACKHDTSARRVRSPFPRQVVSVDLQGALVTHDPCSVLLVTTSHWLFMNSLCQCRPVKLPVMIEMVQTEGAPKM